MEDLKVRKLRQKLGISAEDEKAAAGRAVSPNLQKKISGYSRAGGNFVSAPSTSGAAAAAERRRTGGNFVSAPAMSGAAVADDRLGTGGNFVSAPSMTGTAGT